MQDGEVGTEIAPIIAAGADEVLVNPKLERRLLRAGQGR